MPDREKEYIVGKLQEALEKAENDGCFYAEIRRPIVFDAIALLKEQEAIPVDTKVIGTFNGDMEVYCCRDCRTILDPAFHYCPNCGQAVKWIEVP